MTTSDDLCEVVITAPDPDWLVEFTRELVTEGMCASAHHFAPVRSIYRGQGQVHERQEGMASLLTTQNRVAEIVRRARVRHPHEVPGISARPIVDGNPFYLQWIASGTQQPEAISCDEYTEHQ